MKTAFLLPVSLTEICGMTTEQKRAYNWYVKEHKTAKDIAGRLGRTEKTIGNWVKKFGWKEQRDAKLNSFNAQRQRINEILSEYAEQTLYYIKETKALKEKLRKAMADNKEKAIKKYREQINEYNTELARIDDGASKWRKQLADLDKENRISLSTYLEVMDDVFENMRAFDEALYNRSIEFQENHLQTISLKLG